jgi:transposase InsO family protein
MDEIKDLPKNRYEINGEEDILYQPRFKYTRAQVDDFIEGKKNINSRKWRNVYYDQKKDVLFNKLTNKVIVPNEDKPATIDSIYTNVNNRISYAGRDKVFNELKHMYQNISRRDIGDYIKSNEINQLHTPIKLQNTNKPIISTSSYQRFQIDLVDLSSLLYKDGNRRSYILTCIDIYSKFAWCKALPNKEGPTVANSLNDILNEANASPKIIQTDNGSEFKSNEFETLLKNNNIKHIFSSPYNPKANAIIERFNGTLKRRLEKYLSHLENKNWVSILDQTVNNYNNEIHSTTGYKPVYLDEVGEDHIATQNIEQKALDRVRKSNEKAKLPELRKDDVVRITLFRDPVIRRDKQFYKKSKQLWSDEAYIVNSVSKSKFNSTYKVKEIGTNVVLPGVYLRDELLKIRPELYVFRDKTKYGDENKEIELNKEIENKEDKNKDEQKEKENQDEQKEKEKQIENKEEIKNKNDFDILEEIKKLEDFEKEIKNDKALNEIEKEKALVYSEAAKEILNNEKIGDRIKRIRRNPKPIDRLTY